MPAITHPPLHLQASAGQALTIALDAIPGAGVMWQTPAAPDGCTLVLADTVASGPGVGGQASQRFVLTCSQAGEHHLHFELKRPWESEVRAVQAVVVAVK